MSRILLFLLALTLLAACGKSNEEGTQTHSEQTGRASSDEPVTMIGDDELSEYEKIANASIRPYFDEKATQTEKSVSAGDDFDLYVFGEFNTLYPMSAAEYRLALPEGVVIVSTTESDSTILSMGKPENDFMIAFHCLGGPKEVLVRYQCKATDAFAGGAIETKPGADLNFLGFTMCDATRTLIRAQGGGVKLTKK